MHAAECLFHCYVDKEKLDVMHMIHAMMLHDCFLPTLTFCCLFPPNKPDDKYSDTKKWSVVLMSFRNSFPLDDLELTSISESKKHKVQATQKSMLECFVLFSFLLFGIDNRRVFYTSFYFKKLKYFAV